MSRFPDTITLTKDEALDIVVALEDSITTMTSAGLLAAAVDTQRVLDVLWTRLTDDWPDEQS